jgi:sigma-E factor negative regulatory protein RseA
MNDKLREQMSAFLDDELPDEEADLLLRRLPGDADLRSAAGRFLLIGQALRGERVPGSDLAGRVAAALGGETTYEAEAAPSSRNRWLRPAAGAAVAATVAVLALMGLDENREVASPEAVTADVPEQTAPAAGADDAAEGYAYTVPVDTPVSVRPVNAVPARLTNYMISHGERAGTLMRNGMHSRIVTQPDGRWVSTTVTTEDARTGTSESTVDDAAR